MPLEFQPYDRVDLEKLKQEIEEDRKKVIDILLGKIPESIKDLVKTVLFIVESPNKARTIASFFGKPARRRIGPLDAYEVTIGDKVLIIVATKGHIFDITTEDIPNAYYGVLREGERFVPFYTSIKKCKKCGYQWTNEETETCPRCGASKEFIDDSKERVEALKKLAREADLILIGTDPDSVSGKAKVKVLYNGKEEEIEIEKLFEKWKEDENFEFFILDDHEYLKPKIDVKVLGVDPERLRTIWTKVNYLIRHKVKRKIYKIKTKKGYEIEVTGDHSLFTFINKYQVMEFKDESPGVIINFIIYSDELQNILKNREILIKFVNREAFYEDEIKDILKRVGGQFVKLFVPELKVAIPIYFYGYTRERKEVFAIPLKRKTVLKEVRACNLKAGDKIVVIEGSRVILDEITEISSEVKEEYVYDFDTETDNFIANNILCHNTEGEFIAWSVYLSIKPFGKELYRAEFHEVTRSAILNALKDLKEINLNRVKAQIVRRVEDRWLGFALSKKVQELFKRKTLSAGRVQTPVLGWIIERFREHRQSIQYFVNIKAGDLQITLEDLEIKDRNKLNEIIEKLKNGNIEIIKKEYQIEEVNPLPPYITNTMLNDAIRYMKLGAQEIMQLAQDLFELGLITYHRTDSTRVSPVGIALAKEYISEKWGEEYYRGRTWGEGGAHECIRPTKPYDPETLRRMIAEREIEFARPLTRNHLTLYSLIFYRFIASQMRPAKVKKVKYTIVVNPIDYKKEMEGVVEIVEHGWDLALPYILEQQKIKDFETGILKIDEINYWKGAKVRLYTQADVISLMKERGIGRPSTYAQIVQKLLDRRYVIESKNKRLVPTPLGIKIYTYLNYKYGNLVSELRTKELEQKMDMVEEGKIDYQEILRETYKEMLEVEKSKEDFNELRRILGQRFEAFKRDVRLRVKKRKFVRKFKRYKIR